MNRDIQPDSRGTQRNHRNEYRESMNVLAVEHGQGVELLEALKKNEEHYRTIFEHTGTAMMVSEPDMRITMANHKLEEVTGYSQEEITRQRRWSEFVHEADLPWMIDYHHKRRVTPHLVPDEYEFRFKHRDGSIRMMLVCVSIIPGTQQSLISLMDITRRIEMEDALKRSEAQFKDLFENANDIIYTHDLDGNFLSANVAAMNTYGFSEHEVSSVNIRDLVAQDFLEIVSRNIEEKIRSKDSSPPYEVLTITKSGEPVWLEVNTRLIYDEDGEAVAIQGIGRNITDRKAAEQQLRQSERRFHETAETLPGIICEIDTNGTVTYFNRTGLVIFGYAPEELAPGISAFEFLHPDDVERARMDMENVFRLDYAVPQEYRMRRKNGTYFHALVKGSPILREGRTIGARFCILDVTDRVLAHNQLRISEQRFKTMFSHSPLGSALFTTSGALIEANASFYSIMDVMGRWSGSEKGTLQLLFDTAQDIITRLRKKRRLQFEREWSVQGNDGPKGKCRVFDWHLVFLDGDSEGEGQILIQVQDISARKHAEAHRLKEARDAMEKANNLVIGLRRELLDKARFHTMVSRSPEMKKIFNVLPRMAETDATVLITGASGTGKELIARSLHELGPRREKPFVAVNCSALPDSLLESELFGYKAGAFTDAKKDKPGKFTAAQGGTLFLDEIGEVSAAMQAKLLRVLQERVFEPLGSTCPVNADVRVIAATNRNLAALVGAGEFREDLYYRIKVLTVKLPPLNRRRCDIPLLCDHFIEKCNARYGKNIEAVSEKALEILMAHDFPGNIREMENYIEHAFIFCKDTVIDVQHLPDELSPDIRNPLAGAISSIGDLAELEKLYVEVVLEHTQGNKVEAAKKLGIHKSTLFRKLKQFGIDT